MFLYRVSILTRGRFLFNIDGPETHFIFVYPRVLLCMELSFNGHVYISTCSNVELLEYFDRVV